MTASRPPRLADWLVRHLAAGPKTSSLIGDLHEQYQRGRSRSWYWRQVIAALVGEAWRYKGPAAAVITLGILLPRIYMFLVWPQVTVRLDRMWYPHVIDSRWSWLVIDPWAYRLQPYLWTGRAVWCACIGVTARSIGRWRPSQRGLLLTLFLVTQVGPNIPALQFVLMSWWHMPDKVMWSFGLLWSSALTFIAIPLSIVLGGVWIPKATARAAVK